MLKRWSLPLALLTVLALPVLAMASEGHPSIPGAELSAVWVIPFVCMLLSIAIMPLALPHIWHHHFGKISVFWGLAFLIPCLMVYGFNVAFYEFLHAILLEYIPFIVLLFALFTVAGGVRLKGSLVGTPVVNTGILAVGTILASWMGTTGAAMLLIRPLLRANAHRKYRVHSVVFFIFLVANIGGSLTPLGDPPLFLGYLKGVSFFWTTTNLFVKTCFMSLALLGIYFVLDTVLYGREGRPQPPHDPNKVEEKLGLDGSINLLFLLGIVLCVLVSGMIDLGEAINIHGVGIDGQNLLRDILLLCLAGLSWKFTTRQCRELNGFSWAPIEEVAKLFLGIFLSMIPALAILRAGTDGALAARELHVLLADRRPVQLPGQRAHLPGVLQHRRRRPRAPDDRHGAHSGRHLRRCRVHGRQQLHRQRPQLHGAFHRRRTGRAHAQLLRLHGLVRGYPDPAVPGPDLAVLRLGPAPLRSQGLPGNGRPLFLWAPACGAGSGGAVRFSACICGPPWLMAYLSGCCPSQAADSCPVRQGDPGDKLPLAGQSARGPGRHCFLT